MKKTNSLKKVKTLAVIVPCCNEQEGLENFNSSLYPIFLNLIKNKKISNKSFILYVDDGSLDETWDIIKKLNKKFEYISGLRLEGNTGQQNALKVGINKSLPLSDFVLTLDADGQDDVNAIPAMIDEFLKGNDIVYGVRNNRETDTFFKRNASVLYYKVIKLFGVKVIEDHSEFRIMSKKICEHICKHSERSLYIRGICASINCKYSIVYYPRKSRTAGKTNYSFAKLVETAFDGLSYAGGIPLAYIVYLGIIFLGLSFLIFILSIIFKFNLLYSFILFMSGINLVAIGAVGQYVGRILVQIQNRPIWSEVDFLKCKKTKR